MSYWWHKQPTTTPPLWRRPRPMAEVQAEFERAQAASRAREQAVKRAALKSYESLARAGYDQETIKQMVGDEQWAYIEDHVALQDVAAWEAEMAFNLPYAVRVLNGALETSPSLKSLWREAVATGQIGANKRNLATLLLDAHPDLLRDIRSQFAVQKMGRYLRAFCHHLLNTVHRNVPDLEDEQSAEE